ncbi:MAG: DNA mismatch repair endonuclease MutL [Deltaproteobacteria bacterium]
MAIVRRLPEGLVNQIAAGEVVERPASVVKELCENSIDAGARQVQIDIQEGGTRLIQVIDDGSGMAPDDAELCLERHATSKLRDAASLAAIATLGFRGEALPAIASVSNFTLTTRPKGALAATRVRLSGTGPRAVESAGAPEGTRLEVADLFFNTPARRKFLKRPQTEGSHCAEVVTRLLLSHPEVGFSLTQDGRRVLSSPPDAPLPDRLALALGREVFDHLVEVDRTTGEVEVRGFVASPDVSASNAQKIQLFVNGRGIRDRALSHAVSRAYANLLPPGRYPAGALFLTLPLDRVDVNVHPQKLEVRFADARSVFEALTRAVAEALRPAPWLAGGVREHRAEFGPGSAMSAAPLPDPPPQAGEGTGRRGFDGSELRAELPSTGRQAGRGAGGEGSPPTPPLWASPQGYFSSLRVLGQLAQSYLVCEGKGGALVVLDQHAAHERVLFERFRKSYQQRDVASQRLLLPELVDLGAAPAQALLGREADIRALGFEAEPFGGQSWSVAAVPALLARAAPGALFRDLAEGLVEVGQADATQDAWNDVLATMACHSAVRANDPLGHDELRALLAALDSIDFKVRCPHGRPVVTELTLAELERRVDRR